MEHKTVKSERGTVHYWISRGGEGCKAIVFTHGLTASHEMFEKQVEFFKQNFNVITWDVPMHGLSRPYRDFSYENCARELRAILDAEAVVKAVLVGMSMGGYPSQMFASMYPEAVEGFVALDTTPFGTGYYSKPDLWLLARAGKMARLYPDKALRRSIAKSSTRIRYSRDMMLKMLKPFTKAEIAEQMDIAYTAFIRENRDLDFSFPTLILLGEHDRTGKVQSYCRKWAAKMGHPLVIIKNAAHLSNCDNPEQVNAEILEFVRRL